MPTYTPLKTLDPTRVKAIITTKWSGSAYKAATIRRVESYSIASHLDSDADPWQLELGNVDHTLNAALARDNEVRVQVFGAGPQGNLPLLSGIMDDASYTEAGTLVLTGRDMSSIPVDSDHFPNIWNGISPTKIIEMEAKELKCASKFNINQIYGGPKRQQTDGSEKYWEFWYRMVRKDGMWIWMLADGTLVVSKLNYNDPPVYLFTGMDNAKDGTIPVQNFSFHKTTQGRIGKLGVVWRTQAITTGKKRTVSIFEDVNIKQWIRKPNRIIQDKHAISEKTAYKVAVEELFESRVGAIEIQLTVADPGFMIRQNKMAHVDLPKYGIKGDWFVVGSTLRGGPDGFLQDVRLREKKFAISKRVPSDPIWTKDPASSDISGKPTGKAGKALDAAMNGKGEWWQCFLAAAQKWKGLYDLALYMAALLAICDHETGGSFTNIRSNQMARDPQGGGQTDAPGPQGVNWTDIRDTNPTPAERDAWNKTFANKGGDGYIPSGYACAVGPMQLFDRGAKEEADKIGGGAVDEFFGNRWDACSNIMVAAHLLNGKAKTTDGSAGDLYRGICGYGGEPTDNNGMCGFAFWVKNAIENDPGWLQLVNDALSSVPEDPASGSGELPPAGGCNDNAKQLAKKVLTYMDKDKINIDHDEDREDIRRAAQGLKTKRYDVCLDARILATMIEIADKWGSMRSYAISSGHHDNDSGGWGGHARGYAFDLNGAGGIAFDGAWSPAAKKRDIELCQWLLSYGAPDIRIIADNVGNRTPCDPDITQYCLPAFDRWAVDCKSHSNHIHVCYTPGVPTV